MDTTITTAVFHFEYDLEVILDQLVDANGICRICGQDHSIIQPNTEDLKICIEGIALEVD